MITNSIIVIILLPLFHKQTNTVACGMHIIDLTFASTVQWTTVFSVRNVEKIDVKWCEVWDEK